VTARRLFALLGWACFALALALLVGGVWSALLLANLATGAALPWSVAVMSALLWVLWRYLGGWGWPASTEAARRRRRRARPVPHELMAWALCAGVLGDVALAGAWIVLVQLGGMTGRTLPDFSHYPLYAVALFLTMSSLVNGVTEEVAFRGYLQGELEPELGGVAAVALTALVMAPAHASSQGFAGSMRCSARRRCSRTRCFRGSRRTPSASASSSRPSGPAMESASPWAAEERGPGSGCTSRRPWASAGSRSGASIGSRGTQGAVRCDPPTTPPSDDPYRAPQARVGLLRARYARPLG